MGAQQVQGLLGQADGGDLDVIVTDPAGTHTLFGPPNNKVSLADYAIGLHAASLVVDGGTLQIGIGSLGDAIAQSLIVRDRHGDEFRRIIDSLGVDDEESRLRGDWYATVLPPLDTMSTTSTMSPSAPTAQPGNGGDEAVVSTAAEGDPAWMAAPEASAGGEAPYPAGMSRGELRSRLGDGRPLEPGVRADVWRAQETTHSTLSPRLSVSQIIEEGLLIQKPELLMLDEPVAGMSDAETARTAELLNELRGKHSIMVVEHDMGFVTEIAQQGKVTVLHEGSVLAEGRMDQVQADDRVIDVYLGR